MWEYISIFNNTFFIKSEKPIGKFRKSILNYIRNNLSDILPVYDDNIKLIEDGEDNKFAITIITYDLGRGEIEIKDEVNIVEVLNTYGKAGWELVNIATRAFYIDEIESLFYLNKVGVFTNPENKPKELTRVEYLMKRKVED